MAKAKNDASIYINAAYMAWIHMNDVFTIKVNDQVVTILDGAFLPDSYGSWTNFRSIEVVKANLKEGHNNIRFEFKNYASAINVDYIRID